MTTTTTTTDEQLLALAYEKHPDLPKAGDIRWIHGHEFKVEDPRVHKCREDGGCVFNYQFTHKGVCTDHECNDSIRNTGFNGGRYGFGINL